MCRQEPLVSLISYFSAATIKVAAYLCCFCKIWQVNRYPSIRHQDFKVQNKMTFIRICIQIERSKKLNWVIIISLLRSYFELFRVLCTYVGSSSLLYLYEKDFERRWRVSKESVLCYCSRQSITNNLPNGDTTWVLIPLIFESFTSRYHSTLFLSLHRILSLWHFDFDTQFGVTIEETIGRSLTI